jgi:hypothetical protein
MDPAAHISSTHNILHLLQGSNSLNVDIIFVSVVPCLPPQIRYRHVSKRSVGVNATVPQDLQNTTTCRTALATGLIRIRSFPAVRPNVGRVVAYLGRLVIGHLQRCEVKAFGLLGVSFWSLAFILGLCLLNRRIELVCTLPSES